MLSLLQIEWLKIKKYPAFWWMLGIVALTYPGVNWICYEIYGSITSKKDASGAVAKMILGNPFAFPETWHSVAFFSSWFVFVPAILVIMIITNEYTYKTNRQNIIDGWSRDQFVTSKIFDVAIISVVATLMYVATAALIGFTVKGESNASWTDEIKYIPLFLLQTFAQLTLAFFLGFIIKKSFIALGIFIFYFLIIENILVGFIYKATKSTSLSQFLPLQISNKLIPGLNFWGKMNEVAYKEALDMVNPHIFYTLVITGAIWAFCYWLNNKRDL